MGDSVSDEEVRDLYRRVNDTIDEYHDRDILVSDRLLWALALVQGTMEKRGIRP